jgi:transcription antitermination factor NusG
LRAESLEAKWHVLFVRSNQEKRVVQHLVSRDVEHFLPTYSWVSQWRDRKVKLLKPIFPGYVFVRLLLADRLKVLLVPNVMNLVGTKNAPSIISDEEIEWIKRGVAHGKAEPHPCLTAGDLVVIKAGAMAGIEGVLIRTQNSTRVLIQLNSISRAFTVEVDNTSIVPAIYKSVMRPAC